MYRTLVRTAWLDIHTYGVLVALGFLIGLWTASRRAAQREGFAPEQILDLGVWLIVSGLLSAKLFYVIFFWDDFQNAWQDAGVNSLREGFVFYGGFIGAVLATVLYARRNRLPLWNVADAMAPSVALGHAIGRLGCFFNGCCYGKATTLPWGVPHPNPYATQGATVHPTQLYEVLGNLAICASLSVYYRRKKFDGQIWWLYVLIYGALRFLIEFLRGDYPFRYLGIFTLGQAVAALMMVAAMVALSRGRATSRL